MTRIIVPTLAIVGIVMAGARMMSLHGEPPKPMQSTIPSVVITTPAAGPLVAPSLPTEPAPDHWPAMTAEQRLANASQRRLPGIERDLAAHHLQLGAPLFLRIFKESSELELWLQAAPDQAFQLYKAWPIAAFSGVLGPKQREGDMQAPEGFYSVDARRMNPLSKYHLSFNLGYPNAFDTALGRTGSLLMVHGKNVSIGCYAMTDPVIEEIYLIAAAALAKGQREFPVHCFPFRMTAERMALARSEGSEWVPFWEDLHAGWQAFEKTQRVPTISVVKQRYVVRP